MLDTLNSKTVPELTALYNQYAETPIKRFRDHATAVRRVAKVLAEKEPESP